MALNVTIRINIFGLLPKRD